MGIITQSMSKIHLQTLNVTQKYLLYNLSLFKDGMSQRDQWTSSALDKCSEEAKDYKM